MRSAAFKAFLKRRKLWIIIIGIVLLLGIVVALGLWAATVTRDEHRRVLKTWISQQEEALSTANAQLAEHPKDPGHAITALQNLQQALEHQGPSQPAVLGIGLLPSNVAQAQKQAIESRSRLRQTLDTTKMLLEYQSPVAGILAALSGQSAQNLDQLKTLAASWQTQSTELAAITPPELLKDLHLQLSQSVTQSHGILAELITLFEQQNVEGFQAKQQELINQTASLQMLGDQLAATLKTQDETTAQILHDLQTQTEILRKYVQ